MDTFDHALVSVATPKGRFRRARFSFRDGIGKVIVLEKGKAQAVRTITDATLSNGTTPLRASNESETWTIQLLGGCGCGGARRIKQQLMAFDPWAQ